MLRFILTLTFFVYQISFSYASHQGPEYIKVTHPSTGQTGLMLGTNHIVSLQAVLRHLPTRAGQQILASDYLVVENSADRPVPAIYRKRKKVQKWWRIFRKNPKTLRKILRTIGIQQNSKMIKYHTDAFICDLFIWRCQSLLRKFLKKMAPTVIGCVDTQIETHSRNQGGIVYSLDDNVSEKFCHNKENRLLYSKRRLRNKLHDIKLLRYYLKAARLLKKRTQLKNKVAHTWKKTSRVKLKKRMRKVRKAIKALNRKARNNFKPIQRKSLRNKRKKYRYKHIKLKKFNLVTSTKAFAGIFMQHINNYLQPPAAVQARPNYSRIVIRDQFWHEKMKAHIQTGRNPLFAFGRAHLGNVIKRFQDEGYSVEYMTHDNQWINYPRL